MLAEQAPSTENTSWLLDSLPVLDHFSVKRAHKQRKINEAAGRERRAASIASAVTPGYLIRGSLFCEHDREITRAYHAKVIRKVLHPLGLPALGESSGIRRVFVVSVSLCCS